MERIFVVIGVIFLVLVLVASCDMHMATTRGQTSGDQAMVRGVARSQ